jgi:hypothetical protein
MPLGVGIKNGPLVCLSFSHIQAYKTLMVLIVILLSGEVILNL